MQYFGEFKDHAIHSLIKTSRASVSPAFIASPAIATLENTLTKEVLSFTTDDGVPLSEGDIARQFIVFQFSPSSTGASILDMSSVTPTKNGSTDKPDALAVIQLVAFHVGTVEGIDKETRATLRLDFGKDPSSNSSLDTVFWAVAAGMNLYNEAKKKPTAAKDLRSDFNEAFSRRPIEIPGALGRLSFEVVKHKEPKWWQKVFSFLQSGTGKALTSAVGFPAITQQAIGFLDELVGRLDQSNPEVLFKSRPMTLALTKRAQDAFNAGIPSVSVGVVNPGFCLLARGTDYKTLVGQEPQFLGAYGLLKPKMMKLEDFLQDPNSNPLNAMTYAVIKVGTAETKLSPVLDFG